MKSSWTVNNIPELKGKTILVTGANSGIGFEAAKEFSRKGATVILACRNMEKAEKALNDIKNEIPTALAEIMELDVSSLKSVQLFVEAFKAKHKSLDILLNNAGVMMTPYGKTVDGYELQFATNHLGHFALSGELIDLLRSTPGSRVVNVSSLAHMIGKMDFSDMMFENGKGYTPAKAYGRSKLANLLFTYELQRRFDSMNTDTIAVAAHPGVSSTNLDRHIGDRGIFSVISKNMSQTSAMGALPSIRACVDPDVKGGQYYGPGNFMNMTGYPILVRSNARSHNKKDAKKLWELSEKLTGVKYLSTT
jgi:NAD(P)-dependent dehydrogenase (short-subunit alcohol dehydrogenase family)